MTVKHVVLAAGWPFRQTHFEGEQDFEGEIVHSEDFRSARPYAGKKVLVVGAAASGHDVASDCADNGIGACFVSLRGMHVGRCGDALTRAAQT